MKKKFNSHLKNHNLLIVQLWDAVFNESVGTLNCAKVLLFRCSILFLRQAETDIEGDRIIAVGNGQTWWNLIFFSHMLDIGSSIALFIEIQLLLSYV